MIRRDVVNHDLVSISVYGSHEDLVQHKGISFCLSQENTVDLSTTSNSGNYSLYTNDEKDQNYQLSTTYNEENDETEDTIDTAKKSQSAT